MLMGILVGLVSVCDQQTFQFAALSLEELSSQFSVSVCLLSYDPFASGTWSRLSPSFPSFNFIFRSSDIMPSFCTSIETSRRKYAVSFSITIIATGNRPVQDRSYIKARDLDELQLTSIRTCKPSYVPPCCISAFLAKLELNAAKNVVRSIQNSFLPPFQFKRSELY